MAQWMKTVGSFLIFGRGQKTIHGFLIVGLTNLLLLASIVFCIEMVLIVLGANDIFFPMAGRACDFIANHFF